MNKYINPNFAEQQPETIDILPILMLLKDLKKSIEDKEMPEQKDIIEVKNLDEVHAALKKELSPVIKAIKRIKIPETDSVKVTNLGEVVTALQKLQDLVGGKEFNPTINVASPTVNVPEVRIPEFPQIPAPIVNLPAPMVNVEPTQVNLDLIPILRALQPLQLLSREGSKPISVRLSNGKDFYNAVAQFKESAEKYAFAVSNASGISKDEYKAAQRELYDAATASNTAITVGATSTSVLSARNRISIILTNDSDETIYVSKGSSASMNQGIRLNASGGAVVIDDWNGAVSAICASGSKNLCISETY